MAMEGFSCRKNQKIPGAHKIGAAISGPRITGGIFCGHEAFSENSFFSANGFARIDSSCESPGLLRCGKPQGLPDIFRNSLESVQFLCISVHTLGNKSSQSGNASLRVCQGLQFLHFQSLSLSVILSLSFSLYHSLSIILSLSFSLYHSLSISFSLLFSLFLSLSLSLSQAHVLSFSCSLALILTLSFSFMLILSLSLFVSFSLSLSLSLSLL